MRYAFELARSTGRKKVTVVHKANILKTTSGLFLKVAREVAAQYPDIECNEMIVDNCCMQLVMRPEQFDIIVTTNLFGDIISDLCAGLIGGLGLIPGANIGHEVAIFEAVHGTAPDIAGQGKANPGALLLGAAQMLDHIGKPDQAERLRKAIVATLEAKDSLTPDLGGSGEASLDVAVASLSIHSRHRRVTVQTRARLVKLGDSARCALIEQHVLVPAGVAVIHRERVAVPHHRQARIFFNARG